MLRRGPDSNRQWVSPPALKAGAIPDYATTAILNEIPVWFLNIPVSDANNTVKYGLCITLLMLFSEYTDQYLEMAMGYAPQLLVAIVLLVVGWIVIGIIVRVLRKRLEKNKFDPSLRGFLMSVLSIVLKILLIVTVISMLGVQMTSFIAVIGAAGLAVGLALQGSLANFAGGVLILARKPFKVGEFITGGGVSGTVEEINILYTRLTTPDGQVVFAPNGALSNSDITNFSRNNTRRINLEVGIGYGDDIDKAKKIMSEVLKQDKRLLKEPAHTVHVFELGDSAVGIRGRAWVENKDYWAVLFDLTETIKKTYDKHDISIPYPQRDVHLFKK